MIMRHQHPRPSLQLHTLRSPESGPNVPSSPQSKAESPPQRLQHTHTQYMPSPWPRTPQVTQHPIGGTWCPFRAAASAAGWAATNKSRPQCRPGDREGADAKHRDNVVHDLITGRNSPSRVVRIESCASVEAGKTLSTFLTCQKIHYLRCAYILACGPDAEAIRNVTRHFFFSSCWSSL